MCTMRRKRCRPYAGHVRNAHAGKANRLPTSRYPKENETVASVADDISKMILSESPDPETIYAQIEQEGVKFINLQFTDVMGIVKSVTIPARIFPDIVERGQWIDGS